MHGKDGAQGQAKKKKNGMFGFLTLKEPSTLALEQFAEQQRAAAKAKGTRPSATAAANLTKRLPDHVPKVNSKWDGLPEEARNKAAEQKRMSKRESTLTTTGGQSYRSKNSSSESAQSAQSVRHPFGSISSRPESLGTPPRSRTGSSQSVPQIEPRRSPEYSRPAPVQVHPALRELDSDKELHTFLHPPTPPPNLSELAASANTSRPDYSDLPELAGYEAAAYFTTSAEQSPLTPPASDPTGQIPRALALHLPAVPSDSQGTVWYSDTDNEDVVAVSSSGQAQSGIVQQSLAKTPAMYHITETDSEDSDSEDSDKGEWPLRNTADPSARLETVDTSAHWHRAPMPVELPTVRYSMSSNRSSETAPTVMSPIFSTFGSEATPPSTADSQGPSQMDRPTSPQRSNSDSSITAPSVAPSLAPSAMSAQWNMSPKERLGLGGKVMRKSEVLPWETQQPPMPPGKVEGQASGTRKRLSAMLGRK